MALALAGVVSIRSSMMSEVTRLRSSARRWLVLRPNFFVAMRWRIVSVLNDNPYAVGASWLLALGFRFSLLALSPEPVAYASALPQWPGRTVIRFQIIRSPDLPITRFLKFLSFAVPTDRRLRGNRQLAGRSRNRVALFVDLHAQREAHRGKDLLDLVERLAAEVLGLEHLRLCLLHQLADGLDVRVFQAVVAAHGKLQLFHRPVQVLILDARLVFATGFGLKLLFEVDEDGHVVFQEFGRQAQRIRRGDGTVGPDFDIELVVIGD